MRQNRSAFWSSPDQELLGQLETVPSGLTDEEAARRLILYGRNLLREKKRSDALTLLLAQFKSPIILILLFASLLSSFLGEAILHVHARSIKFAENVELKTVAASWMEFTLE